MRLTIRGLLSLVVAGTIAGVSVTPFASAAVVAHYSFDEVDGTTVTDSSGNGNTGTLHVNGGSGALGAEGKFNKAVSLAGGSWVEATNATFSTIEMTDWSVTAWVTATATFSDSMVIGEFSQPFGANPGSRWRPMNPYLDGGNVHMFSTFRNSSPPNGADVVVSDIPNSIPTDGTTWTFLAVTWDRNAKAMNVYVNGNIVDFQATSALNVDVMPMAATLQIGRKGLTENVAQFWDGKIDEIWAFNEVLSAGAITNLMQFNSVGVSIVPGDFDSDGDVDGADFVAWQTNFPKTGGATLAEGDADADGDVDGADFVVWQTNFPFTPGSAATSVPEPAPILLAVFGSLLLICRRCFAGSQLRHGPIVLKSQCIDRCFA